MKNVVIIGAGQLGSRHLQGVLKSNHEFDVYVVEPFEESRNTAKQRAEEIPNSHTVHFLSEISQLPNEIDLVIVATNSNVRLKVVKELLSSVRVKYLVLEKVLFREAIEYKEAKDLIYQNNVRCFVNHPRRMQVGYGELRDLFSKYQHNEFEIIAYGYNWGLGCNGLHLSDVVSYLLNDKIASYSNKELDQQIFESKRTGYSEFSGAINGMTKQGHSFSLICKNSEDGIVTPLNLTFLSKDIRVSIQEGAKLSAAISERVNGFTTELKVENLLYQSDLSTKIVDEIFTKDSISLTKYEEAMENHLLYISSINEHVSKITGKHTEICPIT